MKKSNSDLMNINSIQDKFTSDKVVYNCAPSKEVLEILNKAVELLNTTIPESLNRISGKESLWKGKSKEEYSELKRFYKMYRKDFTEAVEKYQEVTEGTLYLLSNMHTAKVLKEVENT